MIDEESRRKLRELGLGDMVEALDIQEADSSYMAVPFDDRVRLLVDYTYEAKRQSSVKRFTERARLRFPDADMADMIYEGRGLDEILIRETGTCQFMRSQANVIIEGCTGTGKTFLACCIAKQACRMRMSARYVRLPDLLMERDELAATERSDTKILRKYARYDLLVIDECLTQDIDQRDVGFLFNLIERRYLRKSTVVCSLYSPADWHARLGGSGEAESIADRLSEGAIRIDMGEANVRRLTAGKR